MQMIIPQIEESWKKVLQDQWSKPYLTDLAAFLAQERAGSTPIYPPKKEVFNAFNYTSFADTQVVIIGQDPYHGAGQAHGLSFSVSLTQPLPPSLKNIFKELGQDLQIPPPEKGSLIPWATQGVLLLNAVLTVRANAPKSHADKGWERFTDAVVAELCTRKDPVIFVLWGKTAQDKCRHILEHTNNRHFVLAAAHPSPYSAYQGFFGCRHFSKVNALLTRQHKNTIDWRAVSGPY